MIEISTPEVNATTILSTDQLTSNDDLEPDERRFYNGLYTQLNALQLAPKKETILKILNYSRSKNSL